MTWQHDQDFIQGVKIMETSELPRLFGHDSLISVFQLSEASEHGFADCVFVRVWSSEVVVGAFGAETSSLCSELCLQRTGEHLSTLSR